MIYLVLSLIIVHIGITVFLIMQIKEIKRQVKINYTYIDDTRDKVKYVASSMIAVNSIPDELGKQLEKMKKEVVVKNVLKVP